MKLQTLFVMLGVFFSTAVSAKNVTYEKDGITHHYITYKVMDGLIDTLAKKIGKNHEFKTLVIITRGGLHAGNLLARKLHIKDIKVIGLESYPDNKKQTLTVINPLELPNGGANTIVVDDLADSGATLAYIKEIFPHAKRACLYVKPNGASQVEYFAAEAAQNTWLHFRYEGSYEKFLAGMPKK